jgi:hypothetical protein
MYELGSVDQSYYLKACAWALKFFEQKYGKGDFRHGLLFAHMQGAEWENTFEARFLIHAEEIGCFHASIEECNKHKSELELEKFKDSECQHCRLLRFRKEEWDRKMKI